MPRDSVKTSKIYRRPWEVALGCFLGQGSCFPRLGCSLGCPPLARRRDIRAVPQGLGTLSLIYSLCFACFYPWDNSFVLYWGDTLIFYSFLPFLLYNKKLFDTFFPLNYESFGSRDMVFDSIPLLCLQTDEIISHNKPLVDLMEPSKDIESTISMYDTNFNKLK